MIRIMFSILAAALYFHYEQRLTLLYPKPESNKLSHYNFTLGILGNTNSNYFAEPCPESPWRIV